MPEVEQMYRQARCPRTLCEQKVILDVAPNHGSDQHPTLCAAGAGDGGGRVLGPDELNVTGPPFPSLPGHLVVPATLADGTEVVLKRGADLERESRMLLECPGMVRVLRAEPGLLVLERLGESLVSLEDEEATRIAGSVMLAIRTRPREGFPTLADWARGFRGQPRAERLYRQLLDSQAEPVLLHGDLHHHNILRGPDGWRAIDPQGVIGEPAYEVGAWMRNPLQRVLAMPVSALSRRLDLLSEMLGEDRARLQAWSYAQAVLAGCWSEEDQDGDAAGWLECAARLERA